MPKPKLPIETLLERARQLNESDARQEIVLSRLLQHTANQLLCRHNEALKRYQLNDTLFTALVLLYTSEHYSLQPSELSNLLNTSRTSATRIADELVARGWISRELLDGDRRCFQLTLNETGLAFMQSLLPEQRQRLRNLWAPFSTEEKQQFEYLLHKLLQQR
ncbi:MarR family transcriptional regulator [Plesiomonas shigelloides]|uniref:MarR family transcriptional regulator n=1 Tax=Plesiomonas shigelloides TaxID=703 RepID=UPI0012614C96|nr:MarR family transcriptional regulator [Plesiomonas shigelloides]KAB7709423.1 MarR family transcriptional regulator [Plesiomonas shigelloides]